MPNGKRVKAAVKAIKNDPALVAAIKTVARKADNALDRVAGQPRGPVQRFGRKVGNLVGAPGVGSLVGRGLGRLTGTGDYQIHANSLVFPGSERYMSHSGAGFGSPGPQVVRIRKRERVGTVVSSSTANQFLSTTYRLNPGNPILFPWLSSVMALGFEQWRPMGIVIHLESMASSYATGGTLGSFGVAIDN